MIEKLIAKLLKPPIERSSSLAQLVEVGAVALDGLFAGTGLSHQFLPGVDLPGGALLAGSPILPPGDRPETVRRMAPVR